MTLTAPVRELALVAHVTASVGWFGALAVFFAHALAGRLSHDEQIVRAAALAMGPSAWFVILPLSLAGAAAAATFSSAELIGLRTSLAIHAGGGLLLLLAAVVLAVCKPAGITRYGGRRRLRHESAAAVSESQAIPRWVKLCGAICAVLVLLLVVMLAGGGHGPGAHLSGG